MRHLLPIHVKQAWKWDGKGGENKRYCTRPSCAQEPYVKELCVRVCESIVSVHGIVCAYVHACLHALFRVPLRCITPE